MYFWMLFEMHGQIMRTDFLNERVFETEGELEREQKIVERSSLASCISLYLLSNYCFYQLWEKYKTISR